jgi:hypothetical protein
MDSDIPDNPGWPDECHQCWGRNIVYIKGQALQCPCVLGRQLKESGLTKKLQLRKALLHRHRARLRAHALDN